MSTTHVRPGEGQHHLMIDGDHVAKAAVQDAGGSFEVFEVIAPAAPMAPPHVSPWTGVLFLLQGRITAVVDGTSYDVEPGGLVVVPAGTPTTFGVVGESARLLVITSGDGAGRFFADFASSVPVDRPIEDSMPAIRSVTGAPRRCGRGRGRRTGPARAPKPCGERSAMSKAHRMAAAAPPLVAAALLMPMTAAQATPEGCVQGFSEPGAVTLQQYLAAPRHLAGLEAGMYSVLSLTARFDVIDEDDNGVVCLKAVSNLQGDSDKNWGFFYLADDA